MNYQPEYELIELLVAAINDLPNARANVTQSDGQITDRFRPDAVIEAEISGYPILLLVEAKQNAFPRDVREAVWQLRTHQAHFPHGPRQILPFIVSTAVSAGARDFLKSEKVGYADRGGSLFIPADNVFVLIDRPPPKSVKKVFDSIFQGSKARVLETVFAERDNWLSVSDVAEKAGVAPSTASATLSELERREWVNVRGSGPAKVRCMTDATPMIDAWSEYIENQKPPRVLRYYSPLMDAKRLMHGLDEACHNAGVPYAVTGEAGAQAYAPYLTSISQVRCRMAPSAAQRSALNEIDARPVEEGWNLAVLPVRTEADARTGIRIAGISYASPLRVYLDLLQLPGRARDLAKHLREERLRA